MFCSFTNKKNVFYFDCDLWNFCEKKNNVIVVKDFTISVIFRWIL